MVEQSMVQLIELRGLVRARRAAIIRDATELAVEAIAFEAGVDEGPLAEFIGKHGLEGVTLDIEHNVTVTADSATFQESLHSVMDRFGWKSAVWDSGDDSEWEDN